MNLIKKSVLACVALFSATMALNAGVPPTVMVMPDRAWCTAKNYMTENPKAGGKPLEDYDKALVDPEFVNVRAVINSVMQGEGLPPVDAGAQEESDDLDEQLNEAFEGAQSGAEIKGNAYDDIIANAGPDIVLKIGWDLESAGFQSTVAFRIEALDSYSSKSVASVVGQTAPFGRGTPYIPVLKDEVTKRMPAFVEALRTYFDDVQENGREITLDIRIVDSNDITFSSEYGDKELSEVIFEWLDENTVNHAFNERSAGRTLLRYNQVRIPFYDADGRRMQAKQFTEQLKKYLRRTPYNIKSENKPAGLGRGRLYIGEK